MMSSDDSSRLMLKYVGQLIFFYFYFILYCFIFISVFYAFIKSLRSNQERQKMGNALFYFQLFFFFPCFLFPLHAERLLLSCGKIIKRKCE